MKVGLFFGSFNPIHAGHLIIASSIVEYTTLKEVWFVITPHSPFKKKQSLIPEYDRLRMVELCIEGDDRLRASNVEFMLPKPSYTVDTLTHLEEQYPKRDFSIIMGSDNLETFHKWKNYEVILDNNQIFVYKRKDQELDTDLRGHSKVTILDLPLLDISASYIRNCIKQDRSVKYLVPEPALKYIDQMNLYR